jgi:outer membrane receptor protein involved in Fe transport
VTTGASARNPPSDLPEGSVGDLPDKQRYALARQFEDIWDTDTYDAPPEFGAKFTVGNTVGPIGYLLGGLYKNEWRARTELQQTLQNEGTTDDPVIATQNLFPEVERDRFTSRLAGFLSTAFHLPDEHKMNFTAFVSRRAQDETLIQVKTPENGGVITNQNPESTQIQNRLKYIQDQVAFGQLRGTHPFEWVEAKWRSAVSLSSRQEPDTRHTTFVSSAPGEPLLFSPDSLGGLRIFNDTQEWLSDTGLDLTLPFDTRLPLTKVWSGLPAKLKGGWNYNYRERSFQQRRFEFDADGATQNLARDPEFLFGPGQIGPGGADLAETTLPTDAFDATEAILAGYGMLELPIVRDRLRVVGGVRFEHGVIDVDTATFNDGELCPPDESVCDITISRDEANLLPGVSLVFTPRSDMNLRFSWSKTLSRPDFRELAPAQFPAQRGELSQFGNPDLVQSSWTNYDLRYEWLPSAEDVLSFGAFWKEGTDPIEKVQFASASQSTETWINAEKTEMLGFEFEGRKNFGFLDDRLRNLNGQANVTYFPYKNATVPVGVIGGLATVQTNTERDPADVPNFIVNAAVDYTIPDTMTARLLYTTVGPTLIRAGGQGLPDAFEERADVLDVILQFPLKRWTDMPLTLQIGAENVLNDQVIQTQGDFTVSRYTRGVTFGMSITYAP